MNKGPVLQVDDTKSSTVKKVSDNQKRFFKALESTWHYCHNTSIKPCYLGQPIVFQRHTLSFSEVAL